MALDHDDKPLSYRAHDDVAARLNETRFGLEIWVCYCSTVDDCWTVHGGNHH